MLSAQYSPTKQLLVYAIISLLSFRCITQTIAYIGIEKGADAWHRIAWDGDI